MSVDVVVSDGDLSGDLLAHLELQIASARRLLAIVLEQATAIRRRAIRQVVTAAGQMQAELHRRELLELERDALLIRAGARMAREPQEIGFSSMLTLMDLESAEIASSRTHELQGLLVEIDREHRLNRVLMSQELAFLSHLLNLAGGTGGYGVAAARSARATAGGHHSSVERRPAPLIRAHVCDLEA